MSRRRAGIGLAACSLVLVSELGISAYVGAKLTEGSHRPIDVGAASVDPHFEDVSFRSRDHILLRGWLFHSAMPIPAGLHSRPVVIVVHGYKQNRVNHDFDQVSFARDLLNHGYDTLLFDL